MAEHDHEGVVDALMAAITDEPPPARALDDPEFAAEHRAALADVARLREQLGLVGEALAGPAPPPVRTPAPATARRGARPFALALRTLAAAVVAGLAVGAGWMITQGGAGSGASSRAEKNSVHEGPDEAGTLEPWGAAGYLACARLVVEGTVVRVEPVPGTGQDRVTLDVTRRYKPDEGADEVAFPVQADADPGPREGDHVLVGIAETAATPDLWAVGEEEVAAERARILDAPAGPESAVCE